MLRHTKTAQASNLLAYLLWASAAIFFHQLTHIALFDLLSLRIVLATLMCLVLVTLMGQQSALLALLRARLKLIALSAMLIASNWLLVISSISSEQLNSASLGYYLAPVLTLLLLKLVNREGLQLKEYVCLSLCLCGVLLFIKMQAYAALPWQGLVIALTFALYVVLRRYLREPAVVVLAAEHVCAALPALLYLAWSHYTASGSGLSHQLQQGDIVKLCILGVVTTLPLLFYNFSVKHLSSAFVSLSQYLNPTLMLLIAVLLFKEVVMAGQWLGLAFIWGGIAVYFVLAQRAQAQHAI